MSQKDLRVTPARTVLEQQIRARRQTFEEFVEFAMNFASKHDESGTLSVRHLQRLVSGRLQSVRPATARLLERIFGMAISELLSSPHAVYWRADAYPLRVAIAVVLRGNDVLVVRRRTDGADGILWQFPAGMVKPGLAAKTIAVRETLGETAVHCVVRDELGSRLHPATKVLCDYVLCDYVAGEARNIDAFENADVTWVAKSELGTFIPSDQIYAPVLEALELSAHN